MRHAKKRHKLGRTHAHREATLASLSNALIEHKRITTTLSKAKALRVYVEPIINRAKEDTTHNRREAFKHLQSKESIKLLFDEIAGKIGERPGGYTRVVKLGQRHGDAAEMAIIELVDFNETGPDTDGAGRRKRRTRRGAGTSKSKGAEPVKQQPTTKATKTTDQPTGGEGVDTATVEETVTEEQTKPVPHRSGDEAQAETPEAPEAATESPETEAADPTEEKEAPVAEVETAEPAEEKKEAPAAEVEAPETAEEEKEAPEAEAPDVKDKKKDAPAAEADATESTEGEKPEEDEEKGK
jgi:large subunit ribosomal protein L17